MGWVEDKIKRDEEREAEKARLRELAYTEEVNYKKSLIDAGKAYAKSQCNYLGGHPDMQLSSFGDITINKKGVFFEQIGFKFKAFIIPIESIIKAEFKNDTQISKDVTLTRLLALGVFAFGLKKKTKVEQNYLILTYKEDGIENAIIFEDRLASILASAITKARQEYYKENLKINAEEKSTDSVIDIPEQIKKLADLKEQGILTEEEFVNKKTELLARM